MDTPQSVLGSPAKNTSPVDMSSSCASEKAELRTIGEQIESVSKKLETKGSKVDWKGLHEMGNRVEHFLDGKDSSTTPNAQTEKGFTR